MVNFKEIYHFSRFQRGSNIFQGGGGCPTFSRGVQLLIPYRNPYNLRFSRGGSGPPVPPPSGSALVMILKGISPFKMHIFFSWNLKKCLGFTSQLRWGRVTINTGIFLFGFISTYVRTNSMKNRLSVIWYCFRDKRSWLCYWFKPCHRQYHPIVLCSEISSEHNRVKFVTCKSY